jgi:phospholipase/lecithinase/hemolysin
MVPHFLFLALSLWSSTLLMPLTSQAVPAYDRIVVFGDSLSDSGNAGRFSNGPVWVEQLAARLSQTLIPNQQGGSNFAVGGARLDPHSGPDNLRAQADLYLRMTWPTDRMLHIVYGGGNDLLAAVGSLHAPMMVDTAVASLQSIIADLVGHGATDILLPNLPDVGMTPEMQERGRQAVAEAKMLTDRFNAALERTLGEFEGRDVRLHRLDVKTMAERARADPAAFGFVDITTPCHTLPTCEGYLFWDHVHPTTRAHAHLAEAAFELVIRPR